MIRIKNSNRFRENGKSSYMQEAVQMFFVTQCVSDKTRHQLVQNFIVIAKLYGAVMSLCYPTIVQNFIVGEQ